MPSLPVRERISLAIVLPYCIVGFCSLLCILRDSPARTDSLYLVFLGLAGGGSVGILLLKRRQKHGGKAGEEPKLTKRAKTTTILAGFSATTLYTLGSVYTVHMAPPLFILDLAALALIVGVGVFLSPGRRNLLWLGAGAALVVTIEFVPKVLNSLYPPGLDAPLAGETLEIDWSVEGFEGHRISPVDSPVFYKNATVRVMHEPLRFYQSSPKLPPERSGEEQAATEALGSGNLSGAIARGRLALQINPTSRYARAITGDALLRRGVISSRRGATDQAIEDLISATLLLDETTASARASFALGRLLVYEGKKEEAAGYLKTAVELAPSHPAGLEAAKLLAK